MRGYIVNGPSASGTANKTAVNVIAGSTTVRPQVFEFAVGVATAPNATDQQLNFLIGRTTAVGTAGANPTPLPIDPGDVAAVATAGVTHSAEPTYTADSSLMDSWMNQRAMFRWVATPGQEFKAPATANNGIGLKNKAITAAAVMQGTVMWFE